MLDAADTDETMPSRRGDRARLDARERDILRISATGRGIAEVAEELGLAPEAVRAAIGSACSKLGAGSKLEAVMIAYRDGLIVHPPA